MLITQIPGAIYFECLPNKTRVFEGFRSAVCINISSRDTRETLESDGVVRAYNVANANVTALQNTAVQPGPVFQKVTYGLACDQIKVSAGRVQPTAFQ
jgi:hypothetical protein